MTQPEHGQRVYHRNGEIVTAVVVWLLLGAIVNVAVAWVAFVYARTSILSHPHLQGGSNLPQPDQQTLWNKHATEGWPSNCFVGSSDHWLAEVEHLRNRGIGLISLGSDEDWNRRAMTGIGDFWVQGIRVGFPTRCFQWERWCGSPRYRAFKPSSGDNGWRIGVLEGPGRPILFGFAVNTIVYAAMLWLVLVAPGRFRGWRRIKRGLCPKCAYPVGESTVCTECGRPVIGSAIIDRHGQG